MTLTEEILDNISAYKMETIDAEANVIKAHMEACLRDIRIHEECEELGIVMEGDILPERNGENIFKYLLFFLPRLIINILRKIKEWITGEHIPTPEELKKQQEKEEAETIAKGKADILKKAREVVVKNVNTKLSVKYPSVVCVAKTLNDGYSCMWNIDMEAAKKIYSDYIEYFTKYLDVFTRLNQKSDLAVDGDMIEFDKELARIVNVGGVEGVFSNGPNIEVSLNDVIENRKLWAPNGELNNMGKTIEGLMNNLISLYHEMDQSSKVSASNMRFANRYYNSIERVYALFSSFNTRLGQSISAAGFAYEEIMSQSKSVFEKMKNDKDDALGSYADILTQGGFYNAD